MAKLIIGFIIVFISTLVGGKITDKYKQRASYYECLKGFNLRLKQNLLFKKDKLYLVADYKSKDKDFNLALDDLRAIAFYGDNRGSEIYLPTYLNTEEREFVSEYFLTVGKGNLRSEVELIDSYDSLINDKLSKIQDENKRFSKLGHKVGLAVGLTAFILVI